MIVLEHHTSGQLVDLRTREVINIDRAQLQQLGRFYTTTSRDTLATLLTTSLDLLTESIDTYIVTGDSTRDVGYAHMIAGYRHYLGRLGVNVVDNARSGHKANQWSNNLLSPTVNEAIAATPGTGATTILEMSLGLNDWDLAGDEIQAKADIIAGINAYRAAKPDATVFLAQPVSTESATRNARLYSVYEEIASELSLPLVDTFTITDAIRDGLTTNQYYFDSTHPNVNGAFRVLHYILSAIAAPSVRYALAMDTWYQGFTEDRILDHGSVQSGYFASDGFARTSATWRRTEPYRVLPGQTLEISHNGNRGDSIFWDIEGALVSRSFRDGSNLIAVPNNAYRAVTNITSNATDWLAGDTSVAISVVGEAAPVLDLATVNAGLALSLPATGLPSVETLVSDISAWLDPSDLSTLWQDAGATVPVTASGQPVALMQDKSGNGYHATLTDFVYMTDGQRHWVEPTQPDTTSKMSLPPAASTVLNGSFTATLAFETVVEPNGQYPVLINIDHTDGVSGRQSISLTHHEGALSLTRRRDGAFDGGGVIDHALVNGRDAVATIYVDLANSETFIDDGSASEKDVTPTPTAYDFFSAGISMDMWTGGNAGHFYGMQLASRKLTPTERHLVREGLLLALNGRGW